ncbi:hypothetical protein FSP39_015858 [Pinctada imbricata]|uniref:Reverse transcriptase n=1 Tax=Pinctada imbricata TaxID=66713 RepID=A0AA89BNP8_PINIB|nr:hypothetical protein FSP39_015858 [Pinctada imbricata]
MGRLNIPAVRIVLYLDDGWSVNRDYHSSLLDSGFVFDTLKRAGFVVNFEKSVVKPVNNLSWLGLIWNSEEHSICIPETRIVDLFQSIDHVLSSLRNVSARLLAQVTGRIISMSPVIGNIARIKSRHLYRCIESRFTWDQSFRLIDQAVIEELLFWKFHIRSLNLRKLSEYKISSIVFYSDASNHACGVVTVQGKFDLFHKMWTKEEADSSSTWKELKFIELFLRTFQDSLSGKVVKGFTDGKNCESIVMSGSTKSDLHKIAISIFSLCSECSINLEVKWLPRDQNTVADAASKIFDYDDWGVTLEFFDFVNSIYGPHTVD